MSKDQGEVIHRADPGPGVGVGVSLRSKVLQEAQPKPHSVIIEQKQ